LAFDHRVAGIVDDIAVVAAEADHRVRAARAVQGVVAGIAGDGLARRVAGAVDIAAARQRQVLDRLAAQAEGDRAAYQVDATAARLDHDVARVVDRVGVVGRRPPVILSAPTPPLSPLPPALPGQSVVEVVARAVGVGGAGQGQVLDVGRQHMADRRPHQIGALGQGLDHRVAGVVDFVGVVAQSAGEGVGAAGAIQGVVGLAAEQRVAVGLAGEPHRGQEAGIDERPCRRCPGRCYRSRRGR
jgi:hypothetical protein